MSWPRVKYRQKNHDPGSNLIEKTHDPGSNLVQNRCLSGTILAKKVMTPGQIWLKKVMTPGQIWSKKVMTPGQIWANKVMTPCAIRPTPCPDKFWPLPKGPSIRGRPVKIGIFRLPPPPSVRHYPNVDNLPFPHGRPWKIKIILGVFEIFSQMARFRPKCKEAVLIVKKNQFLIWRIRGK